jgi:hypothetical protein
MDYGFRLPDVVHELDYLSRYFRSRSNSDLCTFDESRFFLRGVLPLPFQESEDEFVWGVWVEVASEEHNYYAETFEDDGRRVPRFIGVIANQLSGYKGTLGLSVEVQLQNEGERPALYIVSSSGHPLEREQQSGITRIRHHDILEATGFFGEVNND